MCKSKKKAMLPRHSAYILSSVKSSLKMTSTLLKRGIYITLSEFDSLIPLLSQHLLYITFESKKKQFVNYITYGEILKLSYWKKVLVKISLKPFSANVALI